MKPWVFPASFLVLSLGAIMISHYALSAQHTGHPAPDFTLADLQGNTHRLSALQGHVIFLNVWATWCPPCREEMPAMEHLYRQLQDRDFAMLAVSEDEGGHAIVAPFVRELGLTFPVLLDPEGVVPRRYGVTGYPETFIIDRNGQVVQHFIGPADWASNDMLQFLTSLLDTPTQSTLHTPLLYHSEEAEKFRAGFAT